MQQGARIEEQSAGQPWLSRASLFFVGMFERYMPDSFVIALLLTMITAVLALLFAPHRTPAVILAGWYKGMFDIASFAFMVALMLVTGYALAVSRPVSKLLSTLASLPRTPAAAATLTVMVIAAASLLHWAFGLTVTGLFAREIAKRMKVDFAWIVAASFSGFALFTQGLSCSVELISATHGSPLNIVERVTGHILPLSESELARFNLIPVVALLVLLPLLFIAMRPTGENVIAADPEKLRKEDEVPVAGAVGRGTTMADRLSRAWWVNLLIVLAGVGYFALNGLSFDLVSVIVMFLIAGMLLHWRPDAYASAINNGARLTGPLLLQFPFYGGIMGIMMTTGLANVIAQWFASFSTSATVPFWGFVSSLIISLFVPSAGGHWAVQGPFIIPVAHTLHSSVAATLIGVSAGEGTADMIQPMWMLPVLAITGVRLRRVMGFTIMSFFTMVIVWSVALLLLTPA